MSGLFAHQTVGDYFTWFNKHRQGMIYSRIDHMLCNVDWFLQFSSCIVEVLEPHISDHSPLKINLELPNPSRQYMFKFLNRLTDCDDFMSKVRTYWSQSDIPRGLCLWSGKNYRGSIIY